MRVLFLSYWGLNNSLTVSTVLPHVGLLQKCAQVAAIRLVTIEREPTSLAFPADFTTPKLSFEPLRSYQKHHVLLTKVTDFVRFPAELEKQAQEFKPDFILARGAPAGALAYLVWRKTKLPFYVESFEPHADYMLESGVWRRYDPRYLFQRYWEKRQKQLAQGLMPVAENYRQQLIREGVPVERIATVPCAVDTSQFAYDEVARQQVRQQLGWVAASVVGIYVGKFGGIYYDDEAFEVFRAAADYFGLGFRLIILTPDPVAGVQAKLSAVGLGSGQCFVAKVPHGKVPHYLSAADFGFATIKPAPCRLFCSAVKIGEYWASGLPVLVPPGVGDDSAIVAAERGGAVFNLAQPASLAQALAAIGQQLRQPNYRAAVRELAVRYRSAEQTRQAYAQLLPVGGVTSFAT